MTSTYSKSTKDGVPSHMNGYLLEQFGKPYVYHSDIAVPTPGPGMLLVRTKVAGYCHTDLAAMSGGYPSPLPIVPGHENVGIVAAIGEGVTGFSIGDRVGAVLYQGACDNCRECNRGTPEYCAKTLLAGLATHGGIAQYFLADSKWTILIPKEMTFTTAAPLMCAGATVYHSLLRCGVEPGGLVGVIGVGGLGHLAVQFAKAMGHNVVAIDTRTAPLELCASLPSHLRPDLSLNATSTKSDEMLKKIEERLVDASVNLPSTGLDAVLVCTEAISAFEMGIDLLAKHGTLVFVGLSERPVPIPFTAFVTKDISVVAGCVPCGRWSGIGLGGVSAKMNKGDSGKTWMSSKEVMQEMMELVQKAGIHVEVLEYAMEDVGKMVQEFGGEGMKGKLVVRVEED